MLFYSLYAAFTAQMLKDTTIYARIGHDINRFVYVILAENDVLGIAGVFTKGELFRNVYILVTHLVEGVVYAESVEYSALAILAALEHQGKPCGVAVALFLLRAHYTLDDIYLLGGEHLGARHYPDIFRSRQLRCKVIIVQAVKELAHLLYLTYKS